jgi:poly(A) polymerase
MTSTRDDALAIVRRLSDAGHVAYFAGGCVRDALLGLQPKDYDVATDAPPDAVRRLFPRTQAVGAAFGVILVREGRSQIDVATFRSDGRYIDGRRPEGVVFTTAEKDAERRDFTINGLFFDPIDERVIDFVGGQQDLQTKTLRAIGDPNERFAEDHLRLLRAVRFAARFGLTIEAKTDHAIRQHVQHLPRISPERIAEELRLMLAPAATRAHAYRLLREYGMIEVVLRFLPPEWVRPSGLFLSVEEPSLQFGTALAALVLDARAGRLLSVADVKKACAALRQSLKISNEETDALEGALTFAHLLGETSKSVATMKRFLALPHSEGAMLMMETLYRFGLMRERIEPTLNALRELQKTDVAPPPLVTGDDLTAAGLMPGKTFKVALDAAYDAQLEGRATTKEQAMEIALQIARSG